MAVALMTTTGMAVSESTKCPKCNCDINISLSASKYFKTISAVTEIIGEKQIYVSAAVLGEYVDKNGRTHNAGYGSNNPNYVRVTASMSSDGSYWERAISTHDSCPHADTFNLYWPSKSDWFNEAPAEEA